VNCDFKRDGSVYSNPEIVLRSSAARGVVGSMSIREALSRKPWLPVVAAVLALGTSGYFITHSGISGQQTMEANAYFSADDGQSTFVAPMSNLPPFDQGGTTAYRAFVFSCDNGSTRFVGYLQRYTPDARRRIMQKLADRQAGISHDPVTAGPRDTEVKKPGSGNSWVSSADPAAAKIVNVTCRDGGNPLPLLP